MTFAQCAGIKMKIIFFSPSFCLRRLSHFFCTWNATNEDEWKKQFLNHTSLTHRKQFIVNNIQHMNVFVYYESRELIVNAIHFTCVTKYFGSEIDKERKDSEKLNSSFDCWWRSVEQIRKSVTDAKCRHNSIARQWTIVIVTICDSHSM